MFTLHAHGIGSGIAIGAARILLHPGHPGEEIPEYAIPPAHVEDEVARLQRAVTRARTALEKVHARLSEEAPGEAGAFLAAHLMMLEDPLLSEEPAALIREQNINAEAALQRHAARLEGFFAAMEDPYLRTKSADVAQVIHRIQGELLEYPMDLGEVPRGAFDGAIIVANDLTPADAVQLKGHRIAAFITNLGGPISHTAILARSLGIPAVVGLRNAIRYLRGGDQLIIDGKRGVVLVDPDSRAVAAYRRRREKILRRIQALDSLRDAAATTLDGEAVSLQVNIESPQEAPLCVTQNAAGVGLYRTEFLFMNRADIPSEEEQFEVYAEVVRCARHPVTIRTLDLGADKQAERGRGGDSAAINPALGRRAIRLCLHDPALFKPQLRAIYRASAFGEVRLMAPMLSGMDELKQLFTLLRQVRGELTEAGHVFAADIPIGGMIEVPAAAVAADMFAQRLDFLSIGTNDLIQYTLAIDRIDDEVSHLYDPLHPALLRLIKNTIDAGRSAGIPVSMCGEMAGDTTYTRLLLGLGLREFSMDPASLPEVKQQLRLTDTTRLAPRIHQLMEATDQEQMRAIVAEINK